MENKKNATFINNPKIYNLKKKNKSKNLNPHTSISTLCLFFSECGNEDIVNKNSVKTFINC